MQSREPLEQLKTTLLTLKDSGDDGFEGLVAALLNEITSVSFRLATSGSQDGQDGRGEGASRAISFEAKLYRSKLTKSVVNNKATEVLASPDPPDLWILAATVGATTQIVGTLAAAFAKVETSLLVLDWPKNDPLPPLALLCAMAPNALVDFLARHSKPPADPDLVRAVLGTLAQSPTFASRSAELRAHLTEPTLGVPLTLAANHSSFRELFGDIDEARHRFGQPLAPAAQHALAPIERHHRRRLDDILTTPPVPEIVVITGDQGCGKSWLVAQSWLANAQPPLMIFLTASEATAALDVAPQTLIARCLIEQSSGITTDTALHRWAKRLERWKEHPASSPRIVFVIDGLNERAHNDWAPWLSRLTKYVGGIGGRVIVTSRARYFKRIEDRFSVPHRIIPVDDFTDAELNAALSAHDISAEQIARRVRPSLRNPRILGIALDLLDKDQINSAQELSIERLLFEYLRTHQSAPAQGETPYMFTRLLGEHARLIRERIEQQAPQDRLIFDSYDTAQAPHYNLPRDLLPVVEERFFKALDGDPSLYQLTDHGLVYGLAIATIRELQTAERNGRSVAERLADIIEPVAALDKVTEVLFAAALLASVDGQISQPLAAALLVRHAIQQNVDEDSFPAYCGIVRKIPAAALDAVFTLATTDRQAQHKDWLIEALRQARDDVSTWTIIADRLDQWLRLYSLNPAHGLMPGENDTTKRLEGIKKNTDKIADRLAGLTTCEKAILDGKLLHSDVVDGASLSEVTFLILAGMPLAPFAEALMCWAFARALNGSYNIPWHDYSFVLQHNRLDWVEARETLHAASACFRRDDASRTARWALVYLLRATGDAEDADYAETLAQSLLKDRQHFGGWRLVEKYCATDPCDPSSERPDNIDETAERFRMLDPSALMINRWAGEHENFVRDAGPGVARFAPASAVAFNREIARDFLTRPSSIAILSLNWLSSAIVLIEPDTVSAMVKRASELSHPDAPNGDVSSKDWVVSQHLLVAAFAHLDGDAQVKILADLPEHGLPLLQLEQVFRPANEDAVDQLVDHAIQSREEHRLLMALAFVRSSQSPVSAALRSKIRQLTDHGKPLVRALAMQISADHPDQDQLAAFAASGWTAANLDPRKGIYERWHGSSLILTAAERGVITGAEAVTRISAERYSDAAQRLGDAAVGQPLARLVEQATACIFDVTIPFRPPRVTQNDTTDTDTFARISLEDDDDTLAIEQRMARLNKSDEDFAARQEAGWDRFQEFESELTKHDADLILRDIGSDAMRAIALHNRASLEALAGQILALSTERLSRVANLAPPMARALSADAAALAVKLFRCCNGHEAYVVITRTLAKIPLITWDIWHSSESDAMHKLWRERLETASSDHDLASEVFAASHAGRHDFLKREALAAIDSGHPVAIARALMIFGFGTESPVARETIDQFGNHKGLIGRAAEAASFAYDRNCWSRAWYERMAKTSDSVDFWRYATLLAKIVDARILLWAVEPMPEGLLDRFGAALEKQIEYRIEAWKKKRKDKLFGSDKPHAIYMPQQLDAKLEALRQKA